MYRFAILLLYVNLTCFLHLPLNLRYNLFIQNAQMVSYSGNTTYDA